MAGAATQLYDKTTLKEKLLNVTEQVKLRNRGSPLVRHTQQQSKKNAFSSFLCNLKPRYARLAGAI